MIAEVRGEEVLVRSQNGRVVVRGHSLNAVGHDRLEVRDVSDDFQRAPLPRNRSSHELLARHPRNRRSQLSGSGEIGISEFIQKLRLHVALRLYDEAHSA